MNYIIENEKPVNIINTVSFIKKNKLKILILNQNIIIKILIINIMVSLMEKDMIYMKILYLYEYRYYSHRDI